ncbi:11217_t:CDS:2, partial [Scutellospora calospora]
HLNKATKLHNEYMIKKNKLTHNDDSGSLGVRVKKQNYDYSYVGENIAWNYENEYDVIKGWMNSE